jgi:hypothetical protein
MLFLLLAIFCHASTERTESVDLQYLAPLSLCYSLTVAQVNVIKSTLLSFYYVV